MQSVPKGLRRHIALVGRRNAGKSSLLNAIARQRVAIVSDVAGTTTDPVEKTMEISPLGPVVLIDTAGTDDTGELGEMRSSGSLAILRRADLAILVADAWEEPERELATTLGKSGIPWLIARNKSDLATRIDSGLYPADVPVVDVSAKTGTGIEELLENLARLVREEDKPDKLLAGLIAPGSVVLLVAPIDSGAPKGRLILPQMQAIRECLDDNALCMIVTEQEFERALAALAGEPSLIVCDSQVVRQIAEKAPQSIPLTTFSILMARFKGDLNAFARGAAAIAKLKPGDRVIIQEACSHHAQKDDIGRVKIPLLLNRIAGGELNFSHYQGKELVDYDGDAKLVTHCGACVITGRQMRVRQEDAEKAGIPMTNYGMTISLCQGALQRALAVFPEALAAYEEALKG